MKKILSYLCALVGLFCLCSCNGNSSSNASASGESHKIGILAPAVTHGWVAGTAFYAEQRCKELAEKGVKYKILTSSNADEMTQQLDDLEAWGAEAIVVYPQWQGMEVPIAAAIKRGTPVVSFDIAVQAEGIHVVSGDNVGMGVESAKYLVDKLGKDATIAVITVPTSGSVSALREQGFMDTVKEIAPGLKLLPYASKFTRDDGLKDMADILVANPRIDGVYSMDDELSIGILQAIREAGRTDIKAITGGGGCQEYFKLMQTTKDIALQSALYSPAMITEAVDEAYDLACGKDAPASRIIPTTIVDAANCADFLNENSPY